MQIKKINMIIPFENKKEAADLLAISISSLNELISIGDIKVYQQNRTRYFDKVELMIYRDTPNENYLKCLKAESVKGETIIISNVPIECISFLEDQKQITGRCRSRQIVNMIKKEMNQKLQSK